MTDLRGTVNEGRERIEAFRHVLVEDGHQHEAVEQQTKGATQVGSGEGRGARKETGTSVRRDGLHTLQVFPKRRQFLVCHLSHIRRHDRIDG